MRPAVPEYCLYSWRADTLLQEPGVIHDQNGLWVYETFDDITAYVVQDLIGVPLDRSSEATSPRM